MEPLRKTRAIEHARNDPTRRLALHGPAVEITNDVPALRPMLDRLLGPFGVSEFPPGFGFTRGIVRPYDTDEVLRRLPADAKLVQRPDDLFEIFALDDCFWIVDDRWGMAEINLLRGQWRSWVLPQPRLDDVRLAEMAVLWPMAQLLKNKGVHWMTAASVVRDGRGLLLISPIGLHPELSGLLEAGYKVVGQRWTILREEDDRIAMLHMPGLIQDTGGPQLRSALEGAGWVNLTQDRPRSTQAHAFCEAVFVVEPGRRARAHLREVAPSDAGAFLRRAWPLPELHPHRRNGQFPTRVAQRTRCFNLQLSRDPKDLLTLLTAITSTPARPARVAA